MKFVQIWRPFSLFWQLRELSVPGAHESVGFTALNRCKAPDSQWASCASCNYCFLSTRVVPDRAHWDPPLNLLDAISQTSRLVAGQPGGGSTQETNAGRGWCMDRHGLILMDGRRSHCYNEPGRIDGSLLRGEEKQRKCCLADTMRRCARPFSAF